MKSVYMSIHDQCIENKKKSINLSHKTIFFKKKIIDSSGLKILLVIFPEFQKKILKPFLLFILNQMPTSCTPISNGENSFKKNSQTSSSFGCQLDANQLQTIFKQGECDPKKFSNHFSFWLPARYQLVASRFKREKNHFSIWLSTKCQLEVIRFWPLQKSV